MMLAHREACEAANLGKIDLAHAMYTSRSPIDRMLDPENVVVSLDTSSRAPWPSASG
jgi:hypothetical protein